MTDITVTTMRWPTELHKGAAEVARSKGLSLSAYIRLLVSEQPEVRQKLDK